LLAASKSWRRWLTKSDPARILVAAIHGLSGEGSQMAKRRVLERLWRLRELEEEQSRLALEARVQDRDRIAQRLESATQGVVQSRRVFADRLGDPDTATRTGALAELGQARRRQAAIRPQFELAEIEVERGREEFLARRTGRRQLETLLERGQQAAREETARRAQQMLDDWYGRRRPSISSSNKSARLGSENAPRASGDLKTSMKSA
jgi:flagellar export protein FliJ